MRQEVEVKNLVVNGNIRLGSKKKTEGYKSLKNNIKSLGIRTPITVKENKDNQFVIVDGHQRYSIAKDLKIDKVPYFVTDEAVDTEVEQASVNLFNIQMNVLEGALVIDKMMERKPDYTAKEIELIFGKSAHWVKNAMHMTNLIPRLKKDISKMDVSIEDTRIVKTIVEIAQHSHQRQENAYNENDGEVKTKWDLEDLAQELKGNICLKDITYDIPLEVLRKYEKEVGWESTYTHSLFPILKENDFYDDKEFLREVYLKETPVGEKLVDIEVNEALNSWHSNSKGYQGSFNSIKGFNKVIKPSKNKIIEWNGNPLNPVFKVSPKNVKIEEPVEKNPFSLAFSKINSLVHPIVMDLSNTINKFERNSNGLNRTFDWIINTLNMTVTIHEISEEATNNTIVDDNITQWYEEALAIARYKEINKLYKAHNRKPIEDIICSMYKNNENDFRKNYLNCFTLSNLMDLIDIPGTYNKKTDVVNYIAEGVDEIVYKDKLMEVINNY